MSHGIRPKVNGDWRRTRAEIDPQILEVVLTVISVGAGHKIAAAQAGIAEKTLKTYITWARDAWECRELDKLPDEPRELERIEFFADFYVRLRKAETNLQAYMLGIISKAAHGDWRAGAWLLEKLYPSQFGHRVELRAEHHVEATVDLSALSVEELRTLKRLRAKIAEGNTDE